MQGLLDDPRFPDSPDLVLPVYSFNSRDAFPDDTHENYGATIEGYLTPKESGDYRFFVYSDDASRLFLSQNETPPDPYFEIPICEETGCCNIFTEPDSPRTSEPIALTAGKKYFIRLIYKEGGGGDYGQVAWRKEGDSTPAARLKPIPGEFLSSAVDLPIPPAAPPELSATRTASGLQITFTGALQSADAVQGPYTDVPGATSPLSIPATAAAKFYRSRN